MKSEPSSWSWDQQVAKGAKGEAWTGVRNFTARQNLVKMKKGDRAFFYHSNEGKEIVGIAEIIKEAYPDPSDKTGKFVCVDIKADKPLKTPVTMAAIKADKRLADMALVKYSRLSVQPVTAEEWKIVCKMGGMYDLTSLSPCGRGWPGKRRQSSLRKRALFRMMRIGVGRNRSRPRTPPSPTRGEGRKVTPPPPSPPAPEAPRASTASDSPSWSRRSVRGCRLRRR